MKKIFSILLIAIVLAVGSHHLVSAQNPFPFGTSVWDYFGSYIIPNPSSTTVRLAELCYIDGSNCDDLSDGLGGGMSDVVDDTTPQLGGDLDLNGFNLDFPTTTDVSDVIDDDTMATASATTLATSESIKAYTDSVAGFSDWVTVGSTGDYATVKDAFDASEQFIYIEEDTTESDDMVVGVNSYVLIGSDVNWDASTFDIVITGFDLVIDGLGWPLSTLTYAHSDAVPLVEGATSVDTVIVKNIRVDNNSTSNTTPIVKNTTSSSYYNLKVEVPNQSLAGIYFADSDSEASNIWIVGGGASSGNTISVTNGKVEKIFFSGDFSSGLKILDLGTSSIGSDIRVFPSGGVNVAVNNSVLNNFFASNANIVIEGTDTKLSNIDLGPANNINVQSFDNNLFQNIEVGELDLSDTSATGNKCVNCDINDPLTIAGDGNVISNSSFDNTVTINSGGDNNQLTENVYRGDVSITGDKNRLSGYFETADTCTLEAGSDNNHIDVTIDQAVTDSGSGNVIESIIY